MNNFWNTQSNFTLISLITFEVLLQTLQNLQDSRRNTIQWCLQNNIVNGWELTSELTSKWIYILKYSSKFTTNLTNNFKSTCSNFTEFTGQWAWYHLMVPAKLHGRRLRIHVWIDVQMNNVWNTQSNFTLISLITFEVFSQTLQNLQGSRRNTIRWYLQNYIVNGWELTSELTSKWINFEILKQIYH